MGDANSDEDEDERAEVALLLPATAPAAAVLLLLLLLLLLAELPVRSLEAERASRCTVAVGGGGTAESAEPRSCTLASVERSA